MKQGTKNKKSVWDPDNTPYGTYEGTPGSPEQWRNEFAWAWDHSEWGRERAQTVLDKDCPFAVLGIPKGSPDNVVKDAFRKLIMIHHPDKGGDHDKAQKIIAAYVFLMER
jgi:hypothetical protein